MLTSSPGRGRPARPIGRKLSHSSIARMGKSDRYRLVLKGDRGTIELKLSEEEVKQLFVDNIDRSAPDTLGLTFTLVPGTVAQLLEDFHKQR